MKLIQVLVAVLAIQYSLAVTGFDISIFSGLVAQSTFECMKNAGFDYVIIQAWNGGYNLNQHIGQNIINAKAAGIPYVDVYAFTCNQCSGNTPSNIANSIKGAMPSAFNGQVWIDVEPCQGCWGSAADNLAFVNSVAEATKGAGITTGVYSSIGSWAAVVGSQGAGTAFLQSLQLWYAHYDGQPNFDDTAFYQFGGWTKPAIKQYSDAGNSCGLTYDYDWYP